MLFGQLHPIVKEIRNIANLTGDDKQKQIFELSLKTSSLSHKDKHLDYKQSQIAAEILIEEFSNHENIKSGNQGLFSIAYHILQMTYGQKGNNEFVAPVAQSMIKSAFKSHALQEKKFDGSIYACPIAFTLNDYGDRYLLSKNDATDLGCFLVNNIRTSDYILKSSHTHPFNRFTEKLHQNIDKDDVVYLSIKGEIEKACQNKFISLISEFQKINLDVTRINEADNSLEMQKNYYRTINNLISFVRY